MKRVATLLFISLLTLGLAAGCKKSDTAKSADNASTPAQASAPEQPTAQLAGKVVETMNSGGYTYIQLDTGKEKIWAAGPEVSVKVGDTVALSPNATPMQKFESKSLQRTFELIYFVDNVLVNGANPTATAAAAAMPEGHPAVAAKTVEKISGIQKADKTVSEVFAEKATLAGKTIKVRGKVVKFSPAIMGKNWLHLQDGSGEAGANDLTITTQATVKQGDTVLVSGVLAVDKDFGYGYKYAVIVEDADVKVE